MRHVLENLSSQLETAVLQRFAGLYRVKGADTLVMQKGEHCMSAAIERRDEQIDSLRSRLASLRRASQEEAKEVLGTAAGLAAAYGFGAIERRAESSPGGRMSSPIEGLDPILVYGAGAFVAGRMVGGDAGNALTNAGRALLTIKAYKAGRESTR